MALPERIRVKLSSEAAESITLTPVVLQEIPIHELIEHILGIAGKDESRIREILLRGTLVSGASRFRWAGWETDSASLQEALAHFPDPDPSAAFASARCIRATLRGGRQAIELLREAAERKSMFQSTSFWDLLMTVVDAAKPKYSAYSYRERADRFVREFTHSEAERLRAGTGALKYNTLRDQIRSNGFDHAELYVKR